MQMWLNNIASNLSAVHKIADNPSGWCDHSFDSTTTTKGPSGGYMLHRPDICVIDRVNQHDSRQTQKEQLHWCKVYAFIDVTANNLNPLQNVLQQITQKAACIFDMQPHRRFACTVGIIGEPTNLQFTFAVVDHVGLTYTPLTIISSHSGITFLKIIFAFCFAKPDAIGWDLIMKVDPKTNELMSITVTGCECNSTTSTTHTFNIIKLLHSSLILYGRGTRVWIVKDWQGSFYVLKDSWILAANVVSEIEFIKHIEKTIKEDQDGYLFQYACPRYIVGQDHVWSMDTVRGMLIDKVPACYQRRIVMAMIGDPITSFHSKQEFVSTCLDLVNGMSLSCIDDEDG
jgi:Fungal protein kinase